MIRSSTGSQAFTAALIAALLALAVPAGGQSEESESPWPADVEGYVAPKAGEHPRLLFRRSDLPEIRRRANTPQGKRIVERLRKLLDGDDGDAMPVAYNSSTKAYQVKNKEYPLGSYTMSHAAGYGMLYQLTGDKKYAELGRNCFDKALEGVRDIDDRYSFRDPGGALRAGPSLGWYALGYDLCYDGWDEQTRVRIAKAIANYNEGRFKSLPELVRGARHMPASNHWGMQVGGGALAVLAIMNDPGVDMNKIRPLLAQSQKAMIRNVTQGFGDGGFFDEGDGTGVMASHIVYLAAVQAWREAGGKDFAAPRPNVRWTFLKFVLQTLPVDDQPVFPKRGAYPHNVWSRQGVSGPGTFCMGLGLAKEEEKPALLWLYNRVSRKLDEQAGGPFETASAYPHRAILSLVNWPFDMQEADPSLSIGNTLSDRQDGQYRFFAMRNRYKDANDVLITVQTRSTRGWHRANTDGSVWVWAHGKKSKIGRLAGTCQTWKPAEDGSAILTVSGTSMAVDFSGASGAEGMIVMAGPGAAGSEKVEVGGKTLFFTFLPADEAPKLTVQGSEVLVGKQKVGYDGADLSLQVFGKGLKAAVPGPVRAGQPLAFEDVRYVPQQPGAAAKLSLHLRPEGTDAFRRVELHPAGQGQTWTARLEGEWTRRPFDYYFAAIEEGLDAVYVPTAGPEAPLRYVPDAAAPEIAGPLTADRVKSYAVDLTWPAATDDVGLAGYRIVRHVGGQKKKLADLSAETTDWTDNAPPAGDKAAYQVEPVDRVGRTGPPVAIELEIPADTAPEMTLALAASPGSKACAVRWTGPIEPDVAAVVVYRKDADGNWKQVAEVEKIDQRRWVDTDRPIGKTQTYAVRLRDRGGHLSDLSKAASAKPAAFVYRVNCGGKEHTTADGAVWRSDYGATGGTGFYQTDKDVAGAPKQLQPVYRTERWANYGLRYRVDVDEPGPYRVRLHLAETNPNFSAKGKRTFDVEINGDKVREGVDVFDAAGGADTAWVLELSARADASRQVDIVLRKASAGPAIKGLEVLSIDKADGDD